jgi:pyruvate formate lyase activating enzyme
MLKGKVFDIKKFAIHDGPGIRTTIFFTGCPLKCWWCHNPEAILLNGNNFGNDKYSHSGTNQYKKVKEYSVDSLLNEILKDRIFYDESGGGVTFSGGEPLVQLDFLNEILIKCKDENLHTTIDTTGYSDYKVLEKISEFTNLFLYDIKLINDKEHLKYTGTSNKLIHENLIRLYEKGIGVRIRIPLIPGITDTDKNLDEIISFLTKLNIDGGVDLLPYNKIGEEKYIRFNQPNKLGALQPQSEEELINIENKFISSGFQVNFRG